MSGSKKNMDQKRKASLTFFKESGKYYGKEEREYPSDLSVYEIIEEIEKNETSHPGMHIHLGFDEKDDIGYPCLILAGQRKKINLSKTEEEWILTDDDSFQIQRCVRDGVYEMYQVQQIKPYPDIQDKCFGIAHSFVFASEINKRDVLDCYGYDSVDEFKAFYGKDWEKVLAECEFELISGSFKNMVSTPDMDWEEAAEMIQELSGYRPN